MYVLLKEITTKLNRLGEYGSYTSAENDMAEICAESWNLKKSDLFVSRIVEECNDKEYVYSVTASGKKKRKFSIEVKD